MMRGLGASSTRSSTASTLAPFRPLAAMPPVNCCKRRIFESTFSAVKVSVLESWATESFTIAR